MSYSCPNDWKRVQVADRFDMALRADVATELAFAEARRQTGSTNPTEPDLVRSFFVHALEEIESEWNSVLGNYNLRLKISGVFSHQTPMAIPLGPQAKSDARKRGIIPNPKKQLCELGDLLFIVSHLGSTKGTGNAMMLQAKKGFHASSDPLQRILYEHSPKFEYRRSTPALNRQRRSLTPKVDTKLAYWDLNPQVHPPLARRSTTIIYASDARIDDFSGASFGDTLTQIVFGQAGTGFSLPTSGHAWSRIVGDLVSVTSKKILTRNPISTRGAQRGHNTNNLAALLASDGQSVLVRNSLGEALLSISDDYEEAAERLTRIPTLEQCRGKFGDLPPIPPTLESRNDDEGNEGGITTIFIRCGFNE